MILFKYSIYKQVIGDIAVHCITIISNKELNTIKTVTAEDNINAKKIIINYYNRNLMLAKPNKND